MTDFQMMVKTKQETEDRGATEEPLQRPRKDTGKDAGLSENPSEVSLDFFSCNASSLSLNFQRRVHPRKFVRAEHGPKSSSAKDIDLYAELQNYLMATSETKLGTKTSPQWGSLEDEELDDKSKRAKNSRSLDSGVFYDADGSKSISSYESAFSADYDPDGSNLDERVSKNQHWSILTALKDLQKTENQEAVEHSRKPGIDRKKLHQEITPKSPKLRTTVFSVPQLEEGTAFSPSHQSLSYALALQPCDNYERISSLETLLLKPSKISMQMFNSGARKKSSDSFNSFSSFEFADKESIKARVTKQKWSPSITDLIDIYNSLSTEKKKKEGPCCFPSYFLSHLHHQIQEQNQIPCLEQLLGKLSQEYEMCRSQNSLKSQREALQNYVSVFHEILTSALKKEQLVKLNIATAKLKDYWMRRNPEPITKQNARKDVSPTEAKTILEQKSPTTVSKPEPEKNKTKNSKKKALSTAVVQISNMEKKNSVPGNIKPVLKPSHETNETLPLKIPELAGKNKLLFMVSLIDKFDGTSRLKNGNSPFLARPKTTLQSTKTYRSTKERSSEAKIKRFPESRSPTPKKSTTISARKIEEKAKESKTGNQVWRSKNMMKSGPKILEPFCKQNGEKNVEYNQRKLQIQHPIIKTSITRTKKETQGKLQEFPKTNKTTSFLTREWNLLKKAESKFLSQENTENLRSRPQAKEGKDNKVTAIINSFMKRNRNSSDESRKKKKMILPERPLTCYPPYYTLNYELIDKNKAKNKTGRQIYKPRSPWGIPPRDSLEDFSKKPRINSESQEIEIKNFDDLYDGALAEDHERANPFVTDTLSTNTFLIADDETNPKQNVQLSCEKNNGNRPRKALFMALETPRASSKDAKKNAKPPKTKDHEFPIVIHEAGSKKSEDVSFPMLLIHSETFIKSCSSFAVTKSKIDALFRCSSEIKFYPGKVADQPEDQKPFVTFVLTPRQTAGLELSDQATTVVRKNSPENSRLGDIALDNKLPLTEIEKFIEQMSEAPKKKTPLTKTNLRNCSPAKKPTMPTILRKPNPTPNFYYQSSVVFDRKPNPYELKMRAKERENDKYGNRQEKRKTDSLENWNSQESEIEPPVGSVVVRRSFRSIPEIYIPLGPKLALAKLPKKPIKTSCQNKDIAFFASLQDCLKVLSEKNKKKYEDDEKVEKEIKSTTIEELSEIHKAEEKTTTDEKKSDECKIKTEDPIKLQGTRVEAPRDGGGFLNFFFPKKEKPRENHSINADEKEKGAQEPPPSGALNGLSGKQLTEENFSVSLSPSDICLLSEVQLNDDSEKKIFNKILKNLQMNHFIYLTLLLEGFLKKAEGCGVKKLANLQNVLKAVERKSKDFMLGLEEKGWVKILSLLEDTRKESKEKTTDFLRRLEQKLNFVRSLIISIQKVSDQRLGKKFSFFPPRTLPSTSRDNFPTRTFSNNHRDNIAPKTEDLLKTKKDRGKTTPIKTLEESDAEDSATEENSEVRPEVLVEVLEEASAIANHAVEEEKKAVLLKNTVNELEQQRFYIRCISTAGYAPKLKTIKSEVEKKLKALQNSVSRLNKKNEKKARDPTTSLLNLIRAYGNFLRRSQALDRKNQLGLSSSHAAAFDECSHLLRFFAKDKEPYPFNQRKSSNRGLDAKSRTSLQAKSPQNRLRVLGIELTDKSNSRQLVDFDNISSSSSKSMQFDVWRLPGTTPKNEKKAAPETWLDQGLLTREGKGFENVDMMVSDCWETSREENSMDFVEQLKDNAEDDTDIPIKKRKLDLDHEGGLSPPYTKEFHMLTEVQKAKILEVIENVIKKLAEEDHPNVREQTEQLKVGVTQRESIEKLFCKKFLLPWVILKAAEMVICHFIQLIFLSEGSYFMRKNEFLPVVVTYYLTLFIFVISMIVHISCFSYVGIQNPCYFMGIISSSILTLTTSFGIVIMLTSMEYYKSFSQIVVLGFLAVLLMSLSAELCLCYAKVKLVWKRIAQTDQCYFT